jgi:uncharacterized protein YjbI with pentapeptide repeats
MNGRSAFFLIFLCLSATPGFPPAFLAGADLAAVFLAGAAFVGAVLAGAAFPFGADFFAGYKENQ